MVIQITVDIKDVKIFIFNIQFLIKANQIMSKLTINNNSNHLIVSFGSQIKSFGKMPPFEFLRFLNKHYPTYDKHFYIDMHQNWYQNGIQGITSSIEETVIYLKNEISKYHTVTFIGTSSGGYAAILFGSLLFVDKVIAFYPQTILKNNNSKNKYNNLRSVINMNTEYHLMADNSSPKGLHHRDHCTNLIKFSNVHIYNFDKLDLRTMRDNGELLLLFKKLIN